MRYSRGVLGGASAGRMGIYPPTNAAHPGPNAHQAKWLIPLPYDLAWDATLIMSPIAQNALPAHPRGPRMQPPGIIEDRFVARAFNPAMTRMRPDFFKKKRGVGHLTRTETPEKMKRLRTVSITSSPTPRGRPKRSIGRYSRPSIPRLKWPLVRPTDCRLRYSTRNPGNQIYSAKRFLAQHKQTNRPQTFQQTPPTQAASLPPKKFESRDDDHPPNKVSQQIYSESNELPRTDVRFSIRGGTRPFPRPIHIFPVLADRFARALSAKAR